MNKILNIIYKAKNEQRKCFYIGFSTMGLSDRKKKHKFQCFKKQLTYKFYNFIRKYGWDSFTWETLAVYSTPEELPSAEMDWLVEQKKEFPNWECLNLTNAGSGLLGYKKSQETKEKHRKSKTNWWILHPDERKKQAELVKTNPYFYSNKKGEDSPLFGIPRTEEVKIKMRKPKPLLQGELNSRAKPVILISPENKIYKLKYYQDFCKEHDLQKSLICRVLKGKRNHHKGWTGKYLEQGVN
jgi:group I intron endonuclease